MRLNRPPPLDRPLILRLEDAVRATLLDDEKVVAEGRLAEEHWEVPTPVGYDLASHASKQYPWYDGHPFATCFVCGPDRDQGDGLRIFPGPIGERRIVAAPWVPAETICDASGVVQPEIVWAALDCPSWFGILAFEPGVNYSLLGQMAARILRRPTAGERCVVIGWARGRDGRKLYGGAAICNSDGILLGSSLATWIELKQPAVPTAESQA